MSRAMRVLKNSLHGMSPQAWLLQLALLHASQQRVLLRFASRL